MHISLEARADAEPGEGGRVRVEVVSTLAGLNALAPEWEALSEARVPWLPFLGPAWSLTWWRHLAERQPLVADRLCVRTIRAEDGRLLGVAPLMLTERPARGPWRVRLLQFIGADPLVTEARGIVCDPAHEAVVYRALVRQLSAEADHWDVMRWSNVPAGGDAESVLAAQGLELVDTAPAHVLDLPPSWAELKARLPRNIKESLRKGYNSLKREGFEFEFFAREGHEAGASGLEDFFELHASRARHGEGVPHNDVFSAAAARGFLREYFAGAPRGAALVFQLVIFGEVVATRLGFRSGRSLYLYYSGYEPAWGRFGVMTTLLAEVLKWAIAQGITSVNLSFGSDVSKTRWRPRALGFREARWHSPSSRGRYLGRSLAGWYALQQHRLYGPMLRRALQRIGVRASVIRG